MSGEFILIDEDNDEFTRSVLEGVPVVGTGEFLSLEEASEEFTQSVLEGVEGEIPVVVPTGGMRRREYIEKTFYVDLPHLNTSARGVSWAKIVSSLSVAEQYNIESILDNFVQSEFGKTGIFLKNLILCRLEGVSKRVDLIKMLSRHEMFLENKVLTTAFYDGKVDILFHVDLVMNKVRTYMKTKKLLKMLDILDTSDSI